jgi:hypothetical protein
MNQRRPGPVQLYGARQYGGPAPGWDAHDAAVEAAFAPFGPSLYSGAAIAQREEELADDRGSMAALIDETLSGLDNAIWPDGSRHMDDFAEI